ncbi:MAG: hypothetical protein GY850_00915, partial [bacterium]|nr:hypothetical protein [bacterium]
MAIYIRSQEELENLVVTMHSDGWSIHGLAGHFQMGRNRVRRILRENESKRDEGHDILAEKKRAPRES